MSDKDQRKGWLRDLQVGDDVLSCSYTNKTICKIVRITPTGKIKVNYRKDGPNTEFNSNGYHHTKGAWGGSIRLEPVTEEFWTQRKINKLTYSISTVIDRRNHITWDPQDLEAVWEILKKYEDKNE